MAKSGISVITRARRALGRLGPIGFLRLVAANIRAYASGAAREHAYVYDPQFDRSFGVDTLGVVELDEMTASGDLAAGAARYEPIQPELFALLLGEIGEIDRAGFVFVDIGSGKGRALILAAQAGFGSVIGVEFDEGLHRAALANIAQIQGRFPGISFELRHEDARSFLPPPQPTVCLVNNPFDPSILQPFIVQLETMISSRSEPFFLIYSHCFHAEVITTRPGWELLAEGFFQSKRHPYLVFKWRI